MAKVKNTLWEMVKRKGKVDGEFLRNAARIAFTECGACRRCSMYCPFGIDIAYLIMTVRRICNLLGVVPQYLQDTTNSHAVTSNQMWVQPDDWIDTLMWQEEDAAGRARRHPHPPRQGGRRRHVLGHRARAEDPGPAHRQHGDDHARPPSVDWTMPSADGWDNSNMAMYSGDFEIMGRVERPHWEKAAAAEGQEGRHGRVRPRLPRGGLRRPQVARLDSSPRSPWSTRSSSTTSSSRADGLKITRKIEEPVTVQDPCNIVRGRGLHDKLRYVVNAICDDFRDMDPRYEHNYCCAGGRRRDQLRPALEALADEDAPGQGRADRGHRRPPDHHPCHNCHSGIEDIIGHYKLGMHVTFINELLVKVMERPDGEEEN